MQTEADGAQTALSDLLQAKKAHERDDTHFSFSEDVLKQLAQIVAEIHQICAEVRDLPRLAKWLEMIVDNKARLQHALCKLRQATEDVERQFRLLMIDLSLRVSRLEARTTPPPPPPSYDASNALPAYARSSQQANENDGGARAEDPDSSRVTRSVYNGLSSVDDEETSTGTESETDSDARQIAAGGSAQLNGLPLPLASDEHEHVPFSPPPPVAAAASVQSPSPDQATSSYIHQAMQLLNGVPGVVEPNLERAMELLETAVDEARKNCSERG